jgi:hypothetical protein
LIEMTVSLHLFVFLASCVISHEIQLCLPKFKVPPIQQKWKMFKCRKKRTALPKEKDGFTNWVDDEKVSQELSEKVV